MHNIQQHIIHQAQREQIAAVRFTDMVQAMQDDFAFEMHLI